MKNFIENNLSSKVDRILTSDNTARHFSISNIERKYQQTNSNYSNSRNQAMRGRAYSNSGNLKLSDTIGQEDACNSSLLLDERMK